MAHKYDIEHLCNWCWGIIDSQSIHTPSLISRCANKSWKEAERVVKLSHSCQKLSLARRLEDEWLEEIQKSSPNISRLAFKAALDAAEGSPVLRQFHGRAYYAHPRATEAFNSPSSIELGNPATYLNYAHSELTEQRINRLCRGFWSLAQVSYRLSLPPTINEKQSCSDHTTDCVTTWEAWWRGKLQGLTNITHDPRKMIERMQVMSGEGICKSISRQVYQPTYRNYVTTSEMVPVPCSADIVQQLSGMTKIFDEALANHFMIP
jgi:hypothetical protein